MLQFKDKGEILFTLLKDELGIEISTVKGNLTELTTIGNRLAHADAVYDVSKSTLYFIFRNGEYAVGDEFKRQIDEKVKVVDTFLNGLLAQPHFAENEELQPTHRRPCDAFVSNVGLSQACDTRELRAVVRGGGVDIQP